MKYLEKFQPGGPIGWTAGMPIEEQASPSLQRARLYGVTPKPEVAEEKVSEEGQKNRDYARRKAAYMEEVARVQDGTRPFVGQLSPGQDFIYTGMPITSTFSIADDMSKSAQLIVPAIKTGQWGAAVGNALKIPSGLVLGAASLVPGVGLANNLIQQAFPLAKKVNDTGRAFVISKELNKGIKNTNLLYKTPKLELQFSPSTRSTGRSYLWGERPELISEAERLGIPRGDRGNLNRFQRDALDDLHQYRVSGQFRQYPRLNSEGNIVWGNGTNEPLLKKFVAPLRGDDYKGTRIIGDINDDGSLRLRLTMSQKDLDGGYVNFDGQSGQILLTSPKMNAINGENDIFQIVSEAPATLPKSGIKTFWTAVQDVAQPGIYISGDFMGRPLGQSLISKYNKIGKPSVTSTNSGQKSISRTNYEDLLQTLYRPYRWKGHADGLSTDSYMALLKQGNRPGYSLRFSPDGMIAFNEQGVENAFMNELLQKANSGAIPKEDFVKAFNEWVKPYGGMEARIVNGQIIMPQPFIYKQQHGGTLKQINYLDLFKQKRK